MDELNGVSLGMDDSESDFEDWSDIDTSGLTDDEDTAPENEAGTEEEADQPETEGDADGEGEETPEEPEGETKEEQKEPDQTFELKHLDETRTVNREEVIALAQKGMDYDRIRGKLDELRGVEAQASENELYAEFVKELADGAGISVEELIDGTRARVLTDRATKEGRSLSHEEALQQAKQTREARAQENQQGKEAREARVKQEHFREETMRFRSLFPEVKAENIPDQVWKEYDQTGNLVDAWNHSENQRLAEENKSLKRELEGLKQEHKNEARSTGSRRSAGAGQRSAVDDAWEAALKSDF